MPVDTKHWNPGSPAVKTELQCNLSQVVKCCGNVSREPDTGTMKNLITNPILALHFQLCLFPTNIFYFLIFFKADLNVYVINLCIIHTSAGFLNWITNGCFLAFHWQSEIFKRISNKTQSVTICSRNRAGYRVNFILVAENFGNNSLANLLQPSLAFIMYAWLEIFIIR